ncbi:MAG: hydroxyacid dehydrogenase [Cytophagales bacterium]|nr:hydroxyacid dehydrogenase [Armatimonadota bacterium]
MTNSTKLRGLFVLGPSVEQIYGPEAQRAIYEQVEIYAPKQTRQSLKENPTILAEAEVIFSGWGGPTLDADFLAVAPRLRAFFYGAGATGGMIHSEAFERGIVVSSAAAVNGVPVAEYTVASIIFALKQAFRFAREIRAAGSYPKERKTIAGAYGSTVGLVSLGAIGRLVCERLKMLEVSVIAHDPFVSSAEAAALGIELVSLESVFERADVVSVHTPWLPETERLVRGSHIAAMKEGATLVNTARGAVIAEEEMIAVLADRPDLSAVLDVTHPEPPLPGSPLYTLPNVFLTPHIAGSLNGECLRMGQAMADEMGRWLRGEPLRYQVRPEASGNTSHRMPAKDDLD